MNQSSSGNSFSPGGRGPGGGGSKRKALKFLTIITPTLPSPIEREGKTRFPDEHELVILMTKVVFPGHEMGVER